MSITIDQFVHIIEYKRKLNYNYRRSDIMEEQYNSILFFNDSIYLLKFVNDLLNRAPTEENFKYLIIQSYK